MKRFMLLTIMGLLGVLNTQGQTRFQRSAETVADMVSQNPSSIHTNVLLSGYYSENDGGGGSFYVCPDDGTSTNRGTVFRSTANPNFLIKRLIPDSRISAAWFGAIPGVVNVHVPMQEASQYASNISGTLYIPGGSYSLNTLNYLHFGCSVDSEPKAILNYVGVSGNGSILKIGGGTDGTIVFDRTFKLPQIIHFWGHDSTTNLVGVRMFNTRGCQVHIPYIMNAGTGLMVGGVSSCSHYDTFYIGSLWNCWKGIFPIACANQETFIGGSILVPDIIDRYITNITGEVHTVYATNMGSAAIQTIGNNNTFLNTSVEGNSFEYMISENGVNNMYINVRFENNADWWNGADETTYHDDTINNARILLGASTEGSQLIGGYEASFVQVTDNSVNSASLTSFTGRSGLAIKSAAPYDAPLTLVNMWGASSPLIHLIDPNFATNGNTFPSYYNAKTNWTTKFSATSAQFKASATNPQPFLEINQSSSRLDFSDGVNVADNTLFRVDANNMGFNNFVFAEGFGVGASANSSYPVMVYGGNHGPLAFRIQNYYDGNGEYGGYTGVGPTDAGTGKGTIYDGVLGPPEFRLYHTGTNAGPTQWTNMFVQNVTAYSDGINLTAQEPYQRIDLAGGGWSPALSVRSNEVRIPLLVSTFGGLGSTNGSVPVIGLFNELKYQPCLFVRSNEVFIQTLTPNTLLGLGESSNVVSIATNTILSYFPFNTNQFTNSAGEFNIDTNKLVANFPFDSTQFTNNAGTFTLLTAYATNINYNADQFGDNAGTLQLDTLVASNLVYDATHFTSVAGALTLLSVPATNIAYSTNHFTNVNNQIALRTVWRDSMVPAAIFKNGTTAPTDVPHRGSTTIILQGWEDSGDTIGSGTIQLNHDCMTNVITLKPHIHYELTNAPVAPNTNIVWQLDWSFANVGEVFGTNQTVLVTNSVDGVAAWQHKIVALGNISVTNNGVSPMFNFAIVRVGSSGSDTHAGTVAVLGFDVHYPADSMGSNEELVK